MKVKYIRKSNVSLTENQVYDVMSVEKGCYRIIDDTGEDYLFQPEDFEIIDDNIGQKTIHEKWEEGGITILPPKENSIKEDLALFKKALDQAITEKANEVDELPDVEYTPLEAHKQKMQEIIRACKEQKNNGNI